MACAGNELNLFLSQLWLGFIIESGRMYLESLMTKSTAEKDLNLSRLTPYLSALDFFKIPV